jgi:hypothetical protein
MSNISIFLNFIHYLIYLFSFFALGRISFLGLQAKWSCRYISIIFILQGIRNGCIFTDLQNYFWNLEHLGQAQNTLLFSTNSNLDFGIRIIYILVGIYIFTQTFIN